jgi:hypothetical protein
MNFTFVYFRWEPNDIDMDLHTKLKSITDKNKDLSIRNLLKSELKFGKANLGFFHV